MYKVELKIEILVDTDSYRKAVNTVQMEYMKAFDNDLFEEVNLKDFKVEHGGK